MRRAPCCRPPRSRAMASSLVSFQPEDSGSPFLTPRFLRGRLGRRLLRRLFGCLSSDRRRRLPALRSLPGWCGRGLRRCSLRLCGLFTPPLAAAMAFASATLAGAAGAAFFGAAAGSLRCCVDVLRGAWAKVATGDADVARLRLPCFCTDVSPIPVYRSPDCRIKGFVTSFGDQSMTCVDSCKPMPVPSAIPGGRSSRPPFVGLPDSLRQRRRGSHGRLHARWRSEPSPARRSHHGRLCDDRRRAEGFREGVTSRPRTRVHPDRARRHRTTDSRPQRSRGEEPRGRIGPPARRRRREGAPTPAGRRLRAAAALRRRAAPVPHRPPANPTARRSAPAAFARSATMRSGPNRIEERSGTMNSSIASAACRRTSSSR